jgi:hypothetical protein
MNPSAHFEMIALSYGFGRAMQVAKFGWSLSVPARRIM